MCVTADRSHALNSEIEWFYLEARLLEERHDEAAQTAINMQAYLVPLCEFAKCYNIILASIRKIDCGPNKLYDSLIA